MKVTLKTIADESGFSVTTVSRALAGYDDVNAETREHIIAIAQRLGYQPNLTARHLRSKHTNTIGMVVPRTAYFSDPFYMELMAGVGREASERGYDLLISAQMHGEEELSAYRRMVAASRVDGVVLARILQDDPRIAYLQQTDHPFVIFGRSEVAEHPYIDVDSGAGIRQVVEHFASFGHHRIGLILSPPELAFTQHRLTGYHQAVTTLRLDDEAALVAQGDLSDTGGEQAAGELLDLATPPTAIVACNDQMALGAMRAIKQRGLRVGVDVAVAGFDDIVAAASADPPLTTVRQPIYEIGGRLAAMLIGLIQQQESVAMQSLVAPRLIIRASSGRPV